MRDRHEAVSTGNARRNKAAYFIGHNECRQLIETSQWEPVTLCGIRLN